MWTQWRDARTRAGSKHAHASQGSGGENTEHHERTCRALISSMAARLTPWSRLCMRIFLTAKGCPVCLCLTFHTTPNEPSPSLATFSYLSAISSGGLPLLHAACFLVSHRYRPAPMPPINRRRSTTDHLVRGGGSAHSRWVRSTTLAAGKGYPSIKRGGVHEGGKNISHLLVFFYFF